MQKERAYSGGSCGKDVCRPILSDFAAIRSDVSIRSCRGGTNFFETKKVSKNVFACPKAAFRSGPIHKKGKHGLCPD